MPKREQKVARKRKRKKREQIEFQTEGNDAYELKLTKWYENSKIMYQVQQPETCDFEIYSCGSTVSRQSKALQHLWIQLKPSTLPMTEKGKGYKYLKCRMSVLSCTISLLQKEKMPSKMKLVYHIWNPISVI